MINKDIANIGSSDPTKIAYEGNWCGNPGEFLHVDKMSQSKGTAGKPDIGWCINETAPGVYKQSCALSETACTKKGAGAIFVNSPTYISWMWSK